MPLEYDLFRQYKEIAGKRHFLGQDHGIGYYQSAKIFTGAEACCHFGQCLDLLAKFDAPVGPPQGLNIQRYARLPQKSASDRKFIFTLRCAPRGV